MKYIKEHIMFIFPMLAILIGIESSIVFNRLSEDYEKDLKADYSMLVLANMPIKLLDFKQLDQRISSAETIEKNAIVKEMIRGMRSISVEDIVHELPYFYTIHFDRYLDTQEINRVKRILTASGGIEKIETFEKSHYASYNLYIFIKVVLWIFVGFMTFASLFLVIKQMEIWQFSHKERMQIMEIFGASAMLRIGILFKHAMIDAAIATILASGLFAFLRFIWIKKIHINLLLEKEVLLFAYRDVAILGGIAILIVIISVIVVTMSSKESRL